MYRLMNTINILSLAVAVFPSRSILFGQKFSNLQYNTTREKEVTGFVFLTLNSISIIFNSFQSTYRSMDTFSLLFFFFPSISSVTIQPGVRYFFWW